MTQAFTRGNWPRLGGCGFVCVPGVCGVAPWVTIPALQKHQYHFRRVAGIDCSHYALRAAHLLGCMVPLTLTIITGAAPLAHHASQAHCTTAAQTEAYLLGCIVPLTSTIITGAAPLRKPTGCGSRGGMKWGSTSGGSTSSGRGCERVCLWVLQLRRLFMWCDWKAPGAACSGAPPAAAAPVQEAAARHSL